MTNTILQYNIYQCYYYHSTFCSSKSSYLTLLNSKNREFFSVKDLCSAVFSIPVHTDNLYLFAFAWNEWQYTRTVMPQGYTENPIYFSHILKVDLDHLVFPHKSILIHYVDDLLLYSNSLINSQQYYFGVTSEASFKGT